MKKIILFAAASVAIGTGAMSIPPAAQAADGVTQTSSPAARTREIVAAATAYLDDLSPEQREAALFAFTPQKVATTVRVGKQAGGEEYGHAVWSDRPITDVPRPGLQLGALSPMQRENAMRLLQTLLSAKGYQKILDILSANQALHEVGTSFPSGRDTYVIGIFGTPSVTTPWMVEFGGHHLGLNVIIDGPHAVITPSVIDAQPVVFRDGDKRVRVLAGENDKGFALINDLNADQRKQAILDHPVTLLALGPGHDGEAVAPEGLKGSAMTLEQRIMLLDLISEWAGIVADAYAKPRMDEIKAGIGETYFAWSGPLTHKPDMNGASYFRIQGPKVWIEFSPEPGPHDPPEQHIHTIYRDPTNEYGQRFTEQ